MTPIAFSRSGQGAPLVLVHALGLSRQSWDPWATDTRRYLATALIGAPVTVAFGSRDILLLRHQSRHLDQLPPGTNVEVLPGGGHVPLSDNPRAVATLVTQTAARAAAEHQGPAAAGR